MKKIIFAIGLILLVSIGCKKDSETSGCWQCEDASGNYLQEVCGDNEQDAFNKSGNIAGTHTIENFRTYCHKK
jgi:uncharacterized lipoprotein NlpE involved in copper resistance